MRVALQISGEFRSLPFCIDSLNKYLFPTFPNTEFDIFLHTWRRDEAGLGTWQFEGRDDWHKQVLVYDHETGLSVFNPRSYFLESYDDRHDLKALPRAYSMFYSIKRANDARKDYETQTETHYDYVIRYRTDCMLNEDLYEAVKDFLQSKQSFLCIPKPKLPANADGPDQNNTDCICDWFAIGTPDAMDVYCGTYDTFVQVGLPIVPESMLAMQLKVKGITQETILKRPDYDMFLIEGNGQIRGL